MIRHRVVTALAARLGCEPPFVSQTVAGSQVTAAYGSFPAKPDYDYGWMYALIAESRTFFDVGCSAGVMSLVACLTSDIRRTVIVDASKEALSGAMKMLIRNGFANRVQAVEAFVSDRDDSSTEFFTVHGGAAGSRFQSHATTAARLGESHDVSTITLDRLVAKVGLAPDLVKVDVEGAEIEVLTGAGRLAESARPRFCVEMHSVPDRPMRNNAGQVLEWCETHVYRAYYLKQHMPLTSPDQVADRGRCHLLLLPSDQVYPAYLREIAQGASFEDGLAVLSGIRK